MNTKPIIALLIALAAAACSDSPSDGGQGDPDPPPPPQNSPIEVTVDVPEAYPWDDEVDKHFTATHPDGFSDGLVEFLLNEEVVWSIHAANRESIDTTWTQDFDLETTPMDFTADLEVRYNLVDAFERVNERNSVSGTESVAVTRSPFTETTVSVNDFFTQQPVTGSLTLSGNRTVPVTNGEAFLSRFEQVNKDSLENGLYRILLEAQDYVTHSSLLTPSDEGLKEVLVLPEEANNWSYELYEDHLFLRQNNKVTQRLKDGETYTVWIYRDHYFAGCEGPGACAVNSSDTNLLASESYLDDNISVWTQVNEYLPNVTIEIKEDINDDDFPTRTQQENIIYISGGPSFPFAITASHRTNHPDWDNRNYIRDVIMFQRTDPPAVFTMWAVWADVINSLALENNGKEMKTVIPDLDNSRPTPFALNALAVLYSTEAGSGVRVDGTFSTSTPILDWIPTHRSTISSVVNEDAFR